MIDYTNSILILDESVRENLQKKLGDKDPMAVITIDNEGSIRLHQSSKVKNRDGDLVTGGFPIETSKIVDVKPIAVVSHTASPICITIVIGGMKYTICYNV